MPHSDETNEAAELQKQRSSRAESKGLFKFLQYPFTSNRVRHSFCLMALAPQSPLSSHVSKFHQAHLPNNKSHLGKRGRGGSDFEVSWITLAQAKERVVFFVSLSLSNWGGFEPLPAKRKQTEAKLRIK